ncbi:MAG: GrpB family protein, partial [bacterium]
NTDFVEIGPPDARWPAAYAEEADAIRQALRAGAAALQFEHVGSTAVPGLAAKPVIDILLVPADGEWPHEAIRGALARLAYSFWASNPDPLHLFFVKGMPPFGERRTHHVHVRPRAQALPLLTFRDRLRAQPELARSYEKLKLELAARFPLDREAYTRGKEEFVARAIESIDPRAPSCLRESHDTPFLHAHGNLRRIPK